MDATTATLITKYTINVCKKVTSDAFKLHLTHTCPEERTTFVDTMAPCLEPANPSMLFTILS